MLLYQLLKATDMPIQQGRGTRPNSAANSLPSAQNSAAGGLGQNTCKALICRVFLTSEGAISGAETGFFPAGRENSDDAIPAQRGDLGVVVAEAAEDLVGVLAEERRRPAIGAGAFGELDRGRGQREGIPEPGERHLFEEAGGADMRVVERLL